MTTNPTVAGPAGATLLPIIKKQTLSISNTEFSLFYSEEFEATLFDSGIATSITTAVEKILEHDLPAYRQQMVIKTVPFLVGFFPSDREIRFYSPRLGSELFLVESLEKSDLANDEAVKFFRAHTEKVALLDARQFPTNYQLVTKMGDLPAMEDQKYVELEESVQVLVEKLLVHLNSYKSTLFEKFSDMGLDFTARFALLRIHLLKFLAILPSLDHDKSGVEVKRILLEALRRLLKDSKRARLKNARGQSGPLPRHLVTLIKLGHFLAFICPASLLASIVRMSVRTMARRFIAGETIEEAEKSFKDLFSTGRDVTLDQLGELVVSEKEADHYCREVLKLIRGFKLHVKRGDKNQAGIHRAHVSIKVSALCSDFKPQAFEETYLLVAPRLREILLAAKEEDVFINIDAEHYHYRDVVFKIYKKVLLDTTELKDYAATGIVIQAYLRDGSQHLTEVIELAKTRGHLMPVRLVKGAYWDAETVEADAHSFDAPEFLNKEETDLHFRQLIVKIFEAHPHLQICLASHNYADHAFAEVVREKLYPQIPAIEHQCLHMTYEALSVGLAKMGWATRNYVPIGSLLVGMAYLVRRIMENSSQVGVLTMMRSHKKKGRMPAPWEVHNQKIKEGRIFRDLCQVSLSSVFFNCAPVRLYLDSELNEVSRELDKFKSQMGLKFVGRGERTGEWHKVHSSSNPDLTVGDIQFANATDVIHTVAKLDESYNKGTWSQSLWQLRAACLVKAAHIMTARRLELSALIVYEAGKSIPEAIGDVDEAIDFLNYYAREEGKFHSKGNNGRTRGVTGVISPWNFPLAIPCGMVAAPLVAGNSVVLKSAEQTPLIAEALADIFYAAGIPQDVFVHLPGMGETVGAQLVKHERVAGVVFTGSKNVGMLIQRECQSRTYHNKLYNISYPARAITEMGGKNAVIVTANAELDETVSGILYSAFGHAGQKCSAASRIIAHNSVKDRLIERLREASMDLKVSAAYKFDCAINPVISLEDRDRLRESAISASKECQQYGGRVVVDRTQEDLAGYCVGPAIFELPFARALKKDSWAQRELFGPIVHVIGFNTLDEALELYNSTEYALTGGVFSQSQDDIDYLVSKMENGNIYINRGITGARVAVEPFGGFKMSGTGPKAGGKAYVPSFHLHSAQHLEGLSDQLQEGSDYRFDLCRPSRLAPEMRISKVERMSVVVLHHFESLFQGIHGENKKLLGLFHKFVREELLNFVMKEHPNRRIPGQMSYNDLLLSEEHTLVVSTLDKPHFDSLMRVLAALAMGTGVTVAARNEQAYQWWSRVRLFAKQSGISKDNFDVYYSSQKQLEEILKNPMISTIISDTAIGELEKLSKMAYLPNSELKRMKRLISLYDGNDVTDLRSLFSTYSWVRALAINTMRHGAPLDLEL